MRAKKIETEIRQEQIAQAALDLIGASGIQSLSLAKVAELVGIVPSGIYRHFKNKDELLNATLDLISKKLENNINLVQKEKSDPMEQLKLLMFVDVEMLLENQAIPHVVFSESLFGKSSFRKDKVGSIMTNYFQEVSTIIQKGQQTGCFRSDMSSWSLALMFKGLLLPAILLSKLDGEKVNLLNHARTAWELFRSAASPKDNLHTTGNLTERF